VFGLVSYHRGLASTAKSNQPITLYGKKHYIIPADDLSAELWAENDSMRHTLEKLHETLHRNFDDDRLGHLAQVAAYMEDEDASDMAFTLIEARAIFVQYDKAF
jgi:hypothetical protein